MAFAAGFALGVCVAFGLMWLAVTWPIDPPGDGPFA